VSSGFINDTHAATAQAFEDAIVRKSLTNERVSTQMCQNILGWGPHQVNEEISATHFTGEELQVEVF